jgi:tRNA (guanine6-N2)-methyltransferase
MCGGGTVPIDAAYMFEHSRLTCIDRNPRHIEGAKLNARAALVYPRIVFKVGDARRLTSLIGSADVLVSNPPYGIRLGSPRQVRRVYQEFLAEATKAITKSIVIITPEYRYAKRILEEHGWKIVHERRVAHGNLYPHILVAKP